MAKATPKTKTTEGELDESAMMGEPLVGEPVLLSGPAMGAVDNADFVEASVLHKRPTLNDSYNARQAMDARNNNVFNDEEDFGDEPCQHFGCKKQST